MLSFSYGFKVKPIFGWLTFKTVFCACANIYFYTLVRNRRSFWNQNNNQKISLWNLCINCRILPRTRRMNVIQCYRRKKLSIWPNRHLFPTRYKGESPIFQIFRANWHFQAWTLSLGMPCTGLSFLQSTKWQRSNIFICTIYKRFIKCFSLEKALLRSSVLLVFFFIAVLFLNNIFNY